MFLKSLTLKGFKSFADKTTLEFQPGVCHRRRGLLAELRLALVARMDCATVSGGGTGLFCWGVCAATPHGIA